MNNTKLKALTIRFSESADQEIYSLVTEMQLVPLAQFLQRSSDPLPEELKRLITKLLSEITDLFSTDLPTIDPDPEHTLRTVSRDINLARLLRERGLFRLYRLVHQKDSNGVPLYMNLINPVTGSPFSKQEEFIGWFCEEAHVARSLAFMRLGTIDKLQTLGFDLQESFTLIITKPWAIRETLNMVAEWDKGQLISVSPEVAENLARRIAPDSVEEIKLLGEASLDNEDARQELKEAAMPMIAQLLTEVASHDRAKDAISFVKNDILNFPEITYWWDKELDCLMVDYVQRGLDRKTGEQYVVDVLKIPFLPDVGSLPNDVRKDLIKRLPMKNRNELD